MIEKKPHLFIFAGEPSGDLHAAHLIKALKKQLHDYHFSGVAGPCLRAEGIETILNMENFSVMGFSDVLKNFPALYKQFYKVRDYILTTQPEIVVFIDYPGFNLRMAKALRKAGFKGKLVHYICPSVWAWGKKRIIHMSNTLDMLLTIYPFEAAAFEHTSLNVKYISNPLQEYISQYVYHSSWKSHFPIQHPLIAIFPGSREGEIKRNLKTQLQAASLFQKKHPHATFGISCSHPELRCLIETMIDAEGLKNAFTIPKHLTYELMRDSHSAIAKSGTVTLELALHKRPTVVVYELSTLNWLIAKFLIRLNLPHYCIVNILSQKRVFPELIEKGFTPENLAHELEKIHEGTARDQCIVGCQEVVNLFQSSQASVQAAEAIKLLLS